MSEQNFLSFLQQILTMVDPKSRESVELCHNALSAVIELALASQKVNSHTLRMMRAADYMFMDLVEHSDHFAGKPGQYQENEHKRRRLANLIYPSC